MGFTQPNGYVHPKQRKSGAKGAQTDTARMANPELPANGSQGNPDKKKKAEDSFAKDAQIRLVVYPPVVGQVPLFDQMIKANYPPNKALLGLLKKGFPSFEADLLAGKIEAQSDELQTSGKPVDTTRNVTSEFLKRAKELYDPFDVLSDRAIGQRVAEAVLRSIGQEAPLG